MYLIIHRCSQSLIFLNKLALYILSPQEKFNVLVYVILRFLCKTNFLLDEDSTIGKDGTHCHSPNSIISLIHRYLQEKSYGEKYSVFHADNAAGQNKNKTMLHYLSWRCFKGLNTEISLHFMTAGHTKCICDA